MKVTTLLFTLLFAMIFGMLYIIVAQGNTISQQRTLIRQMVQNPYCLIP